MVELADVRRFTVEWERTASLQTGDENARQFGSQPSDLRKQRLRNFPAAAGRGKPANAERVENALVLAEVQRGRLSACCGNASGAHR
jgi:hypothetical protein